MIKENFIKLYENSFKENWDLPCYTDYGEDTTFTYGQVAEEIAKIHLLFQYCSLQMCIRDRDCGQYDTVTEVMWVTGAALFIRLADYREVGGLDDHLFAHMEEIDLCWRLRSRGKKLVCIPQSVVSVSYTHLVCKSFEMNSLSGICCINAELFSTSSTSSEYSQSFTQKENWHCFLK